MPKDSFSTRSKRKKSSKATAPKRPPERGLGIAQLERLHLQKRWKMITEIVLALQIQPFPGHLPVYDYPITVAPALASVPPPVPAAVAACGGGWAHAPGTCYIQRCQGLAMRSVLHKQYQMRMGQGGPVPGRVQRNGGADYFEMDLAAAMAVDQESQRSFGCVQRRGKSATESSEAKEFDFFPQNRSASLGHSEFGNRTVGDASSSSSSSAAASPSFLDLSLKLSI